MYWNFWDKIIKQKKAMEIKTIVWDWNDSLGDTIREKYESLYVKCHEIINKMMDNRPDFALMGWGIFTVFDCATSGGFNSAESSDERHVAYAGQQWGLKLDIYESKSMPQNQILFFNQNQIYRLVVKNFVI